MFGSGAIVSMIEGNLRGLVIGGCGGGEESECGIPTDVQNSIGRAKGPTRTRDGTSKDGQFQG